MGDSVPLPIVSKGLKVLKHTRYLWDFYEGPVDAWALLIETAPYGPRTMEDGTICTPVPPLPAVEGATQFRLSGTMDNPYWIVIVKDQDNNAYLQQQGHHKSTPATDVSTGASTKTDELDPTKGEETKQTKAGLTHPENINLSDVFLMTRSDPQPLGAKDGIWLPKLELKLNPVKIKLNHIPDTFALRISDLTPKNSHTEASHYNLTDHLDANFCFHFWLTKDGCRKGEACLYRHCPPNAEERQFLYTIGATKFLWNLYKTWKAKYEHHSLRQFPFTRLQLTYDEVPQEHLPWEVLEWDEKAVKMWPMLESINQQWDSLWERQQQFQRMRTHRHGPGPSKGQGYR